MMSLLGSALFALQSLHSLKSTSGATHCQPLDGQQCGAAIEDDGPMFHLLIFKVSCQVKDSCNIT